jgi:hypothetical protein
MLLMNRHELLMPVEPDVAIGGSSATQIPLHA